MSDYSGKSLDAGASSATKENEFTNSIWEESKPTSEPADKFSDMHSNQTSGAPIFSAEGAVGKQFTTSGTLGGTAEKIGGPLGKEGLLGKMFKEDGPIGGTVEKTLGSGEDKK